MDSNKTSINENTIDIQTVPELNLGSNLLLDKTSEKPPNEEANATKTTTKSKSKSNNGNTDTKSKIDGPATKKSKLNHTEKSPEKKSKEGTSKNKNKAKDNTPEKKKAKISSKIESEVASTKNENIKAKASSKIETEVATKNENTQEKKRRAANKAAMEKIETHSDDESDSDRSGSGGSDAEFDNHDNQDKRIPSIIEKSKAAKKKSASLLSGTSSFSSLGKGTATGAGAGAGSSRDNVSGAVKRRSSRIGDPEWEGALWAEERVSAVSKAIDRVYEMSLHEDNFDLFGNDMIQCFYDVSTVTGEPIRHKTLKYLEYLAHRWKYGTMQQGWKCETDGLPSANEVIDVVIGMYCMERVGIRHDLKGEVLDFMRSPNAYPATSYFGWNPPVEPPPVGGCEEVLSGEMVSVYRTMSNSLIHCFYADRVGLHLGCTFADIFRWLPNLRPYKGPHELDWQTYIDQCYLITHIVFTTNNWGELSLDPAMFPHEYFFLRSNLEIHLQQRDIHLIAEFVETLRAFGCSDNDILIQRGMRALLSMQQESGIWDPSDEPYRTYHATMCGAQALLAHKYRGFGPGIPDVLPLLIQWTKDDLNKMDLYKTMLSDQPSVNSQKNNHSKQWEFRVSVDRPRDRASEDLVDQLRTHMRGALKNASSSSSTTTTTTTTKKPASAPSSTAITAAAAAVKVVTESQSAKDKPKSKTDKKPPLELTVKAKLQNFDDVLRKYLSSGAVGQRDAALQQKIISSLLEAKDLKVTHELLKGVPSAGRGVKTLSKDKGKGEAMDDIVAATAALVLSAWKERVGITPITPAVAVTPLPSTTATETTDDTSPATGTITTATYSTDTAPSSSPTPLPPSDSASMAVVEREEEMFTGIVAEETDGSSVSATDVMMTTDSDSTTTMEEVDNIQTAVTVAEAEAVVAVEVVEAEGVGDVDTETTDSTAAVEHTIVTEDNSSGSSCDYVVDEEDPVVDNNCSSEMEVAT